jgi:hypothetical protein
MGGTERMAEIERMIAEWPGHDQNKGKTIL